MTLIAAARAIAQAESAKRHRVEDLRGAEAIEYAAQHPGTPVMVDPDQWMAYDGLGATVWAPTWEEVTRIVRDRNGEQEE